MSHASSDSYANDADVGLSIPSGTMKTPSLPSITDLLDCPLIQVDRSCKIISVNDATTTWFGRTRQELLGVDLLSVWTDSALDPFAETIQRLLTDADAQPTDLDAFLNDRRVRVRVQPNDLGLLLLVMERSHEEDALRFQAGLLDQAYSAYFAWDLNGGIFLWNRGAENLYGYSRDEAIGQVSHDLLNTVHPNGKQAVSETLLREGVWHGELLHTRADGTTILVESRHQLVVDGDRKIVLEANRDISEPRRLYQQARLSEERLRMALAGSSILVYQQDLDLRYTWLYNALGRWGDSVIGQTDDDIFPAEEADALRAIKQRVLETGQIERAEIESTLNQRDFRYSLTVEPLLDNTGAITGVTGSVIDITRQREREQQIAKLQALTAALAGAVDADSVARAIVDYGVSAVAANLGIVTVLSANGESLITRAMTGFRTDESFKWLRIPLSTPSGIVEAAHNRTAVYIETKEARRNRYPISARVQAAGEDGAAVALPLLVDDRLIGVLGFGWSDERHFDTEARDFLGALADLCAQALERARLYDAERQARDAAQVAETRYRGLFERSADAVLIIDENGSFQDGNSAALRLLGYDLDELCRLRLNDIARPLENSEDEAIPLDPSSDSWSREFDLCRHDGSFVPVEARATTIQTPTGPATMIAARDISDRVMFQRMQQEFFASLSHDLKNPLSALRGQVQLLQRRLRRKGKLEATDVETGLETIESVGDRMTGMIEELVDVAQLRGGNALRLKLKYTDLAAITAHRVRDHQQATTRHAIRLDLDETAVSGWWDESRLGRVVDNLLTNAIKYSQGGDIVVKLWRESRTDGEWALLSIADAGLGIPEADLPRIFERFRRGSNVLDRFAGTGLGLAGVRQIVLQHGGDVSITSKEGVGTTVTVELPITDPPTASDEQ